MAKKDGNERTLVPELRFPEFQRDEDWKKKPLAQFLEPYSAKVSPATGLPVYSSTRYGLQLQAEYYGGKNRTNEGDYGVVPNGYFVYRHMSDDGVFKFNINTTGEHIAVSKEYPVFTTRNLNGNFLLHLIDWSHEFKEFCLSQKKGGTRTRLYLRALGKWKPALASLPEQQKIADCLGSLDDLIAAHSAKLDALQDHKKGLLQQLFPAEGQTTPTLRFPEFEGGWRETTLRDACLMKAGKFVKVAEINALPKGSLYPCYGGNGLRGYTATYTHEGRYSLIGRQGALCGNVQLASGRFHATEHAVVVDPAKNASSDWLFYALIFLNLNRFATGQAQPGLSVEVLERVPITIPSEFEQQKIADCLSTLDALITAQTEQIVVLKDHKKGLMQQLFPNPELSNA